MGERISLGFVRVGPNKLLRDLAPWKECWRIKFNRIQCTVTKEFIAYFEGIIREGGVYWLSQFILVPNVGQVKVTKHRSRLLFQRETELIHIPDENITIANFLVETVEIVIRNTKESPYLIVVLLQSAKIKVVGGKVGLQNVINCSKVIVNLDTLETSRFLHLLDPKEVYFIDTITVGNGFVVADLDDDFLNMSMNRTIRDLKEDDEDGCFNVNGRIKSICSNYDWWYYCCVGGYPLQIESNGLSCSNCRPEMFNDIMGKEVLFKVVRKRVGNTPYMGDFKVVNSCDNPAIVAKFKLGPISNKFDQPRILSPVYEDIIRNPALHFDVTSLASRLSIDFHKIDAIERNLETLSAEQDSKKSGEQFYSDYSVLLSGLIGKKMVFMIDVEPVMEHALCPAYNVYRTCDDDLIKLFTIFDARAARKHAAAFSDVGSSSNLNSIASLPVIDNVVKIICKQRVTATYSYAPTIVKEKLEEAFTLCVENRFSDDEDDNAEQLMGSN
ncbi:hypothetical protein PIB30_053684 [Stylosanthes scabra]|uniref:Replication protein A 70 kDa DNA-binding subunit B/D first OB fold domain-containing protein n=1 Tax=Stylosanthes scabra TaxID=79078 RepID=A0ABU6VJI3_9FABA|nr:hypothetical protein [Stylosanthes scabra]